SICLLFLQELKLPSDRTDQQPSNQRGQLHQSGAAECHSMPSFCASKQASANTTRNPCCFVFKSCFAQLSASDLRFVRNSGEQAKPSDIFRSFSSQRIRSSNAMSAAESRYDYLHHSLPHHSFMFDWLFVNTQSGDHMQGGQLCTKRSAPLRLATAKQTILGAHSHR